jgi:polyferredoxin
MECVGCTACIDACDTVMDKIGKPNGLIRYASENSIANGERLHYTTRMKLYTILCAVVLTVLGSLLATRKDIDATVMRTPGILFQERGADSVSNLYNIKVVNKSTKEVPLTVKLKDGNGKIEIIGRPFIKVAKEGQGSGSFFIVIPRSRINKRSIPLFLSLYNGDEKITDLQTNFLAPVQVSE